MSGVPGLPAPKSGFKRLTGSDTHRSVGLRVTRPCCSPSGSGEGEWAAPPSRRGSKTLWLEAAPVEGLERWELSTEHFWVRATQSESDASKFPFNSSHCCDWKALRGPGRGRGSRELLGVVEGPRPSLSLQDLEGALFPSFQPQGFRNGDKGSHEDKLLSFRAVI